MKPCIELARTTTPDGEQLTLLQHSADYYIEVDGETLMSTRASGSERALADRALTGLEEARNPRILIGGLGLGFTLGAALDRLPRNATVIVAEVMAPIVEWNRKFSFESSQDRLADPRVIVRLLDVVTVLRKAAMSYDAILLDVDNGPDAFTLDSNYRLYNLDGLVGILKALKPGGVLAVWSAEPAPAFARRMRRAGFQTQVTTARSRVRKGVTNTIFLGRRPAGGSPGSAPGCTAARRARGSG